MAEIWSNNKVMAVVAAYFGVALVARMAWGVDWVVPCVWRGITGIMCPCCGLTTAMVRLIEGDIVAAWDSNPLVFVVLPLGIVSIIKSYGKQAKHSIR